MDKVKEVRNSFETQLKSASERILELETELQKTKEYKMKLIGGLETLELLGFSEETEETKADVSSSD
jgi:hypothetical protein